MGPIHRMGKRSDVNTFNFVSTDSFEGIILDRLFSKLEEIRVPLGDRVFDVVGQLLALNEIRLEDMLREVDINRARVEEYPGQIERLSTEQLAQLEQATGVALATAQVDLAWVHGTDIRSHERRLMPEYVEKFFLRAAEREQMSMRHLVDGLYTIERVPARLREQHLVTARRYGVPAQEYRKLTLAHTVQQREEHQHAV